LLKSGGRRGSPQGSGATDSALVKNALSNEGL
jgi:hypothetical protein